jgi:tRNA 2-thiouridine synthesizing protein A
MRKFLMFEHADHQLDAKGLLCPEPVMLLHNKVRDMSSGETLHVSATDPSTQRDIPKFCMFLGHELLDQQATEHCFEYLIKKC